jgi:hypothetical protein
MIGQASEAVYAIDDFNLCLPALVPLAALA